LSWTQQVFAYCERGLDPGFWAEPLNALSNMAFFIAALASLQLWINRPRSERGWTELLLIGLIFAIGTGSFLFHTLATKWAAVADTVPIGLFMVAYLVYAVRRFAGFPWWGVAMATLAFAATLPPSSMVRCGGGPCLNGSVAYFPAFITLLIVGSLLALRGHPAARGLFAGGLLFATSLAFRTLDRTLCPYTFMRAAGSVGTHFLWHLLNGVLLYMLMRAAILHGRRETGAPSTVVA
jgi:hypothetical protein